MHPKLRWGFRITSSPLKRLQGTRGTFSRSRMISASKRDVPFFKWRPINHVASRLTETPPRTTANTARSFQILCVVPLIISSAWTIPALTAYRSRTPTKLRASRQMVPRPGGHLQITTGTDVRQPRLPMIMFVLFLLPQGRAGQYFQNQHARLRHFVSGTRMILPAT